MKSDPMYNPFIQNIQNKFFAFVFVALFFNSCTQITHNFHIRINFLTIGILWEFMPRNIHELLFFQDQLYKAQSAAFHIFYHVPNLICDSYYLQIMFNRSRLPSSYGCCRLIFVKWIWLRLLSGSMFIHIHMLNLLNVIG